MPGIGKKTAERLTYHVLRVGKPEALALAEAIRSVKENVHYCKACYNLAEGERCEICQDPRAIRHSCALWNSRSFDGARAGRRYRGLYHVLLGRMAPLEGVGPDQLTIDPWSSGCAADSFVR